MNIGMTYDLREEYLAQGFTGQETAEFDRPDTIDAIEGALQSSGHTTDRIGSAMSLAKRLVAGERWDMVFNIAEGLYGYGREALVPALLDAFRIPYVFSDPLVLSLTLHKGMTKRAIRDMGIATPEFAVIETEGDIADVNLPLPLFAKPVAEGTSKGISAASRIGSTEELGKTCRALLKAFRQPVIVETYLPGREFTVGVIGTGNRAEVLGIMEIHLKEQAEQGVYSYANKENYQKLVEYRLAADPEARKAGAVALDAWRGLGCRDGGRVDIRNDANGVPNFIEVNPLAGLHPVHSDLPIICRLSGIAYQDLINRIMDSARERLNGSADPS